MKKNDLYSSVFLFLILIAQINNDIIKYYELQ